MNQIYNKSVYKIYHTKDGYILHNTSMDGFAHTHLKNYQTAVCLAELSIHKRIPHHLNRYLIISLLRVNDDEEYCKKIRDLLNNHKRKDNYFNSNKGIRR
jgi:hypothetical protein